MVDDQRDVGQDVSWLTAESVGGSLLIEGDPVALRRLVANVVENSLKYGNCARVRLHTHSGFAVIEVDMMGPVFPNPSNSVFSIPFSVRRAHGIERPAASGLA